MGIVKRGTVTAVILLGLTSATEPVLSQGTGIGYQPVDIAEGYTLISNPHGSGENRIDDLFTDVPDGFELRKLSGDVWITNRFESGSWMLPDWTLTPGEGALVHSPSAFTWNSIGLPSVGSLLNVIPAGESLRASILPLEGPATSRLEFPEAEGLTLSSVDAIEGTFTVVATFENGAWTPGEPVFPIGGAYLVDSPRTLLWEIDYPVENDGNPLRFSLQPGDAALLEGEELILSALATGGSSIGYQWQRNGNDIPGARDATYAVPEVSLADAGIYTVVVHTGNYSLRSMAATVTVEEDDTNGPDPDPAVLTIALGAEGTKLILTLTGTEGEVFRIESSDSVIGGEWLVEAQIVIGAEGVAVLTVAAPDEATAMRFFRAVRPLNPTPV